MSTARCSSRPTTARTVSSCGRPTARQPGRSSSPTSTPAAPTPAPTALANVNGTLFFAADDGTHGVELWKSNGTAAGTVLVADINPGSANSAPTALADVNGTLFFAADDGTHGTRAVEERRRRRRAPSSSTTLPPAAALPLPPPLPTSTARCSLLLTTVPTASRCGRATAARPGPF